MSEQQEATPGERPGYGQARRRDRPGVGGIVAYYWFENQAAWFRAASYAGRRRAAGAGPRAGRRRSAAPRWRFILSSRNEVRKMVWPTREETLQTTLVVIVVVLIAGCVHVAAGPGPVLGAARHHRPGSMSMALRWYVVHAYSGFEQTVRRSLSERVKRSGLDREVRRDPGAHRGSGGDARGPEAQERAQVLPRLRAGADGAGRRDLAPGQERAEGHGFHRRYPGQAGADHRQGSRRHPAARAGRRGEAASPRCCSSRARWCA